MTHLLVHIPYKDVINPPLRLPRRPQADHYRRPPRELYKYVPDVTATLTR